MREKIVGLLVRFLQGKTEEERKTFTAVVSLVIAAVLVGLFFSVFALLPVEIATYVVLYTSLFVIVVVLTFVLYRFVIWPCIQRFGRGEKE